MTEEGAGHIDGTPVGDVLVSFLKDTAMMPASELTRIVDTAGQALGAQSARLLIADYGLTSLQALGEHGPTGPRLPIAGTLAGRSFARAEAVTSGGEPTTVWLPLSDGSERVGVLELAHGSWSADLHAKLEPVLRLLVLVLLSRQRYTDVLLRSRRSEPLSLAAELQWELLPPLAYSTARASVSGILEPAYSIGGDSFDYAFNPHRVEFAIIDAVGHGLAAVSISVTAINSLRNARRDATPLERAYTNTGDAIEAQFGDSSFATAQIGSLALDTGVLTWLNAGHPLPLLVRNLSYGGELGCEPSRPMGLGGSVAEVATYKLQAGDRVLFYTDGVIESTTTDGEQFGVARLADYAVRATGEHLSPAETVRSLSTAIMAYNDDRLSDDATLLLIEYHGAAPQD